MPNKLAVVPRSPSTGNRVAVVFFDRSHREYLDSEVVARPLDPKIGDSRPSATGVLIVRTPTHTATFPLSSVLYWEVWPQ